MSIMTHSQLHSLRKLLCLSTHEARTLFGSGEASDKSWSQLENSNTPVSEKVQGIVSGLIKARETIISDPDLQSPLTSQYFRDYNSYCQAGGRGILMWRLAQSVSTALLAKVITHKGDESVIKAVGLSESIIEAIEYAESHNNLSYSPLDAIFKVRFDVSDEHGFIKKLMSYAFFPISPNNIISEDEVNSSLVIHMLNSGNQINAYEMIGTPVRVSLGDSCLSSCSYF